MGAPMALSSSVGCGCGGLLHNMEALATQVQGWAKAWRKLVDRE